MHTHNHTHVWNLSSVCLSPSQMNLLSRGLSFIPSFHQQPNLREALPKLTRSYRLRYYFRNSEPIRTKAPPFRKPSSWMPPRADPDTEAFLNSLPEALDAIPAKKITRNLTNQEWQDLRSLSTNRSLVINKADKGSCVVVLDREEYELAGVTHLADRAIYQPIDSDPTPQLASAINSYLSTLLRKGLLHHSLVNYLEVPQDVRTQKLYLLLKLHKNPVDYRPIVSGCSGPTEKISSLMDYYLQPLVQACSSYIKDSKTVIQRLEQLHLPQSALLATIDVKALYLSIPQDEGIQSSINHLSRTICTDTEPPFDMTVASELMTIVLKHNYFDFNAEMYQQIRGTAMGTKMAPAFAGLFMADLEEEFLEQEVVKPVVWWRYIDDILCVWPGDAESLQSFISRLNCFHHTLRFTYEHSEESVVFLDINIYKGPRFRRSGVLDVAPHFKGTNTFQYLHATSCHPPTAFRGVIKGELVRMLRASSSMETFAKFKAIILKHLRHRGYSRRLLSRVSREVVFVDRATHLLDKQIEKENPPIFITKFHQGTQVKDIRSALTPISEDVTRPLVAFKKGKTLSTHLVRAKLPGSPCPPTLDRQITLFHRPSMKQISTPCGLALCRCCSIMSKKEKVFDRRGRPFSISEGTSCSSSSVVYLLECVKCRNGRYVGQTARTLRTRMAGHRAASIYKQLPLYRHFRQDSHTFSDLRVTVLEKVSTDRLLLRELYWMTTLETILPLGLNSKFS